MPQAHPCDLMRLAPAKNPRTIAGQKRHWTFMRRGGKSRLICLLAVQSPANNKKPWRFQIAFSLGLVSERANERTNEPKPN
ncbi:hypothetical protein CCHR01_18799 [Colletotrichum chrysophilum]|uniref:Uncharacterized protein n=1 Tax=Colletotrichum chrysophilum TaxID=1836956 RepID=A0AAD8ZZN1_9PEZI|nr:hypothetical protein CCHR01_18799 [Colletotrichum chrysophilum]